MTEGDIVFKDGALIPFDTKLASGEGVSIHLSIGDLYHSTLSDTACWDL